MTTGNDDNEKLRHEIEELRQEALRRIEALNAKLASLSSLDSADSTGPKATTATVATTIKASPPASKLAPTNDDADDDASKVLPKLEQQQGLEENRPFVKKIAVSNDPSVVALSTERKQQQQQQTTTATTKTSETKKHESDLLDGTFWKLTLNVGRESGTWMPKTWGASGDRLLLHLSVEFTSAQLYDQDDFLSGMAGAKVLHVVDNQLTLAPTLTEGSRVVKVLDGGWRVCKGAGPLGTDLLRFYVELEEEVRHVGSDMYCPSGRVYGTCGYFPMSQSRHSSTSSTKERYQKRLNVIQQETEDINDVMERDDTNIIQKLKLSKELIDKKVQARKMIQRLNELRIREPDLSLLRVSKGDGDVGLTKEGGLCCKVSKGGISMEYHILGKFSVAAIVEPERQDHDP